MKTFSASEWLSNKIQASCDPGELQEIAEELMSLITEDDILSTFEGQITEDDLGFLQAYSAVAVNLPFSNKLYLVLFQRDFSRPDFTPPTEKDSADMDAAFAPEFQRMGSDLIIYESTTTDPPKRRGQYPLRILEIHNTGLDNESVVRILDAVRTVNLRRHYDTTLTT